MGCKKIFGCLNKLFGNPVYPWYDSLTERDFNQGVTNMVTMEKDKIEKADIGARIFDCTDVFFKNVMRGQRNFGTGRAKLAVELVGGNILTWIDDGMAKERQRLWHNFINREEE